MTWNLDSIFQSTILREYKASTAILEVFRTKLLTIADGRRKGAVCGWWLNEISEKSDEYLNSQEVIVMFFFFLVFYFIPLIIFFFIGIC